MDRKSEETRKGFSGLSDLVSDVDAEIAKARKALERQQVSPVASDIKSSTASLYESSGEEVSRKPDQQPPPEPNFVLVDKPYFGGNKRGMRERPKIKSEKGESPNRSLWEGILAIGAAVGLICILVYLSINNSNPQSVENPVPSAVPTQKPLRFDTPQNTPVPKEGTPKYVGPLEKQPNAKPDREPTEWSTEQKPPLGTDNVLNAAQIRYCLSEDIRIQGAESVVSSYNHAEVDRYNLMIEDFNSRCAKFRYKQGTLESIQLEVDGNRTRLLAEGTGRIKNNQGSQSLPTPGAQYSHNRQYPGQFGTDSDPKKTQLSLATPQPQLSASDPESIKRSVYNYYELVEKKDVDGAMKCYAVDKLPQIKKSRLAAVAMDTEYYKIENINVIFAGDDSKAKAVTSIVHKKYKSAPELWEITVELTKENGEWKICGTPGHKISH